ncbi:hypothetical protein ANCDUO_01142 [Ancylostoma duodenale]|uniref:Uncharacterized protein n=1 Tax=Ancylostoma duodenale TaxID=51022 RepID=A0A0C2H3W6_9BILA|nr:hypothetical protein ANCDUO_01142 [Ancylostoma duodenale]
MALRLSLKTVSGGGLTLPKQMTQMVTINRRLLDPLTWLIFSFLATASRYSVRSKFSAQFSAKLSNVVITVSW